MNIHYVHHESPIGKLLLVANATTIVGLHLMLGKPALQRHPGWRRGKDHPVLDLAACELDAYFAGDLRTFTVPVVAQGSAFQQNVWAALSAIPYGATRSYSEQAQAIGRPTAVRAVGAANGKNPIGIIIPCHRVIGANGALTGYAGGLAAKQFLLELEAR